jgi:membrane-associated phospholipid phosphatase
MFDLTKPWPPGLNRETCFLFVLGIAVAVLVVSQIDVPASRDAIGWPAWARAPFFWITDYGLSDWVLIPSSVVFTAAVFAGHFLRGIKRVACYEVSMLAGFIFVGVGLPGLVANLLKRLVGRGRPDMFDELGAFSFHNIFNNWTLQSFPSGHATTAVGVAFVVGFIVPRLFGWLLAVGILIGISRVVVGAHYPSDVFAGACLGLIGAYAVRNFFATRGWLFKRRADGCIVTRPLAAIRRLYRRARA